MKEYSILELQEAFEKGEFNSKSLVKDFLMQINTLDKNGPKLNSIIEINPDVIEIAEKLDKEREENKLRSNMHGIPVLLKDNILTGDKMQTTAGSLALEGYKSDHDAFIVQKLRKSGAIILGKTNLSEWANFRSIHSSSGWSSRGRQTKNPYVLDRTPSGSSAGSAVAVAANLCTVAIGTETDGSILSPSHMNSIVGIKPTLGLVSRSGIIPIAHSQDTAGPMARSVMDAAILLNCIIGYDPKDIITENCKNHARIDYTQFLTLEKLDKIRIGVVRDLTGYHKLLDIKFEESINIFKNLSVQIIDPVNLEIKKEVEDAEFEVLLYEFKEDLNKFLQNSSPHTPISDLEQLIDFNTKNIDRVMPYFGQEILEMAQKKGDLESEDYKKALNLCKTSTGVNGIDRLMKEHNLDALIAPTTNPGCPIDLLLGDHYTGSSTSSAAIAGYPSITIPMGYINEMPVGISIFGAAFSEPILLKIAYNFEHVSNIRISPKFLPTISFE